MATEWPLQPVLPDCAWVRDGAVGECDDRENDCEDGYEEEGPHFHTANHSASEEASHERTCNRQGFISQFSRASVNSRFEPRGNLKLEGQEVPREEGLEAGGEEAGTAGD
ncbi:MAG: hypothetical protein WBV31_06000 [Terriglobales bacterium]